LHDILRISLNTSVSGAIENSGLIIGGDGAAIYLSTFYGPEGGTAIENTGSIIGETGTGLVIDVTNWYGDIVNSGLIDGAVHGPRSTARRSRATSSTMVRSPAGS
jgi:hypothetical protein